MFLGVHWVSLYLLAKSPLWIPKLRGDEIVTKKADGSMKKILEKKFQWFLNDKRKFIFWDKLNSAILVITYY